MSGSNVPPLAPALVRRAIDIYMSRAYAASAPATVQKRIDELNASSDEGFYNSPSLERAPRNDSASPQSYGLRLGNSFYPHMKLRIDSAPDQSGYLLKADTHDRHCCPPPSSREYAAFTHLVERNQKLAQEIELAWAEAGLPTFKTYLRQDLARRRGLP